MQNRTLGQGRGQARSRTQITCSGAVRAATQARGLPHLSAARRAFSSRLFIIQCEAASPPSPDSYRAQAASGCWPVWYWPRDPPRGFRETRAQDGGQVFGGYAVQVQLDCTQRLDRAPHGGSGLATSPAWEAPGGVIRAAPASVRPHREHKQSPWDGATPRMTAAAIAGRGAGPTPARRRRLGTKWESRALARALHSSIPLTCARAHLRKYGPDLVVAIGMHGWGSRGRRQ
jgi:hypothetical protein